jgi:hypothetical protein
LDGEFNSPPPPPGSSEAAASKKPALFCLNETLMTKPGVSVRSAWLDDFEYH